MSIRSLVFSLSAAMGLVTAATGAQAGGIIEINQDCALAGCFPGDTPGFPVTITQPGHYRLSSHLATDPSQAAISANVPGGDVALDLGGYAVRGPYSCADTPVTACSGAGSATNGVSLVVRSGSVRNGVIAGYGLRGLIVTTAGPFLIEALTAAENANGGVAVGMTSGAVGVVTRDSRFIRNGGVGYNDALGVNQAGHIENSFFLGNQFDGVRTSTGTILRSTFQDNGGTAAMGFVAGCRIAYSLMWNNNGGGAQTTGCSGIGNQCGTGAC